MTKDRNLEEEEKLLIIIITIWLTMAAIIGVTIVILHSIDLNKRDR
jgi:hypothetical protein